MSDADRPAGDGSDDAPDAVEVTLVTVADRTLAVESGRIDQVVDREPPTPVPGTPPAVDGVQDVGGEVTAVVDVADTFDLEATPTPTGAGLPPGVGGGLVADDDREDSGPDQVLVLADGGRQRTGLRVHDLEGVDTFPLDAVVPADDLRVGDVGLDPTLLRAAIELGDGELLPVVDPDAVLERVRSDRTAGGR